MSAWLAGCVAIAVAASSVRADVDLDLRPVSSVVETGGTVEVGLYAVANSGVNESMSGLDAVILWDKTKLELTGVTNNPDYAWIFAGLLGDSGADGLNDSLSDGDAYFQAVGQFAVPAIATPQGFLVTTLQFVALDRAECAWVAIDAARGRFSRSEVFRFGAVNEDIVGALGVTTVAIADATRLWIPDVHVRPGRTADVMVFGEIAGGETFGVRVQTEIVATDTASGNVTFTAAPPLDIFQAGDPWDAAGMFTPFDTDTAVDADGNPSVLLNGSVADNGSFVASALGYWGPLSGFPVDVSSGADGSWLLQLDTQTGVSLWEPELQTELISGTLRTVGAGDGDASGVADVLDFSQFQGCFTGPVGPTAEPAYDRDPRRRCGVYDENADGDVDADDYAAFHFALEGPAL